MRIEDITIGMKLNVITRPRNPLSNSALQRKEPGCHTCVVDAIDIRSTASGIFVDVHGIWKVHSGYSKESISKEEIFHTKTFPLGFEMFDIISGSAELDSREDLSTASQHLTECGTMETQVSSGAQNGENIMARTPRKSVPQEINLPGTNDESPETPDNSQEVPEMNEPENNVTESGTEENTTGELSDTVTEENSSSDGTSETDNSQEPEVPAFVIPDDPSELDLGEEMATMAGQRLLKLRKAIVGIDNKLRATEDADSEAAIVMFAESDEADEETKAQLLAVREAEKILADAMSNLTTVVKNSRGDVTLTEEDKTAMREDRTNKVGMFKTTVKFIADMATMNEVPEDVTRFLASVEIPGARKSGASRGTSSTYQQTTSVRPRLGDDGYIEIDGADMKFKKFTDAIKWLRANGAKEVTTGAIHNAWADAGNFNIADWASAPTDVKFQIGSGDNVHQISIHFTYSAESTAA